MQSTNSQTNKFYNSISEIYDYIFPLKKQALEFTKTLISKESIVIDAGCATGSLSIALSPFCNKVYGFDLDENMIEIAKAKSDTFKNINFLKGNLLNMTDSFIDLSCNLLVCYGNTLVHMLSTDQISEFLKQAFKILKPGGHIALQILNYNYILDNNITQLPTIENDHVRFIRNYDIKANNRVIDFNTELTLKENGEVINNSVKLLAIRPEEIEKLIREQNFSNIKTYSSFKHEKMSNNKLPLILIADKH